MRIMVVGATGVIGQQLVPMLVDEGHEVVATTTSSAKTGTLAAAGAEPLVLDVLDPAATEEALRATRPEIVVYQATALSSFGTNMRRFDRYFAVTNRLRTEGVANLMAAVVRIGGARVIAQSFGGFGFPPDGPPAQDESAGFNPHPPAALAATFAALRRLEDLVTAEPGHVVLRYGGLYGPGTSLDRHGAQIEAIRRRLLPVVGDGGGVVSYLHVADAATATVAALDAGRGIYNIVDDQPAAFRDWLPVVADVIGAGRPRHLPVPLARILAGDAAVYLFTRARGGSNARAAAELGWKPAYPDWRAGFGAALAA
jgi:nucleoside-diphosphate-sugar epimerase